MSRSTSGSSCTCERITIDAARTGTTRCCRSIRSCSWTACWEPSRTSRSPHSAGTSLRPAQSSDSSSDKSTSGGGTRPTWAGGRRHGRPGSQGGSGSSSPRTMTGTTETPRSSSGTSSGSTMRRPARASPGCAPSAGEPGGERPRSEVRYEDGRDAPRFGGRDRYRAPDVAEPERG